jgi:hypothetical protein
MRVTNGSDGPGGNKRVARTLLIRYFRRVKSIKFTELAAFLGLSQDSEFHLVGRAFTTTMYRLGRRSRGHQVCAHIRPQGNLLLLELLHGVSPRFIG